MKKLVFLYIILSCNLLFSQLNTGGKYDIIPINRSLISPPEGFYISSGVNPSIKFKEIKIEKEKPQSLPELEGINYLDILNNGIYSLIFKNKYYGDISFFSIFGMDGYNHVKENMLDVANEIFFPNKELLNELYKYFVPEYKEAFQSLSYLEQKQFLVKLDMAENFVINKLQKNDDKKFKEWLSINELNFHSDITGFLKRRVLKNQWTVKDCIFWIHKIRKDFKPLLKSDIPQNRYYFIEAFNDSTYIVMDHRINFYVADNEYNLCSDQKYETLYIEDNQIKGQAKDGFKSVSVYPVEYNNMSDSFFIINDSLILRYQYTPFVHLYVKKTSENHHTFPLDSIAYEPVQPYFDPSIDVWSITNYHTGAIVEKAITDVRFGYLSGVPFVEFTKILRLDPENETAIINNINSYIIENVTINDSLPISSFETYDPETYESKREYLIESFSDKGKTLAFKYQTERGKTVVVDLLLNELFLFKEQINIEIRNGDLVFH